MLAKDDDRAIDVDSFVIDETAVIKNPHRIGRVQSIQNIRDDRDEREIMIFVDWFDGTDHYEEPSLSDELIVVEKPSAREIITIGTIPNHASQ